MNIDKAKTQKKQDKPVLSEKDFYPPSDDRCWKSNLDDIKGGDNFADYAEYYFRTYIEEDWLVALFVLIMK